MKSKIKQNLSYCCIQHILKGATFMLKANGFCVDQQIFLNLVHCSEQKIFVSLFTVSLQLEELFASVCRQVSIFYANYGCSGAIC